MAPRRSTGNRATQRGAALLILLLLILLATTYTVIDALNAARIDIARQKKTSEALAQAKAALIAWSVLQGDVGTGTFPRPGSLPCPDRTNSGTQGASCSAAGGTTVGRLPWKTLGIEDLRDADGERLWYALSDNFRKANSGTFPPINSDTTGSLQLYASDGTTLLTPVGEELAAIVFSAGSPLPGQDRGTDPNDAANYLDAAAISRNNAIASGPFITGPIKSTSGDTLLNDRVQGISAQELIGAIEKRVLKEAQNALAAYLAVTGKYPNPAKSNGTYCATTKSSITDTSNICNSDSTTCFGRLPEDSIGLSYAASWFIQNGWGRNLTFAVNKGIVLDDTGFECSTSLTVDGQLKSYILIAPGARKSGQSRPSTALANYLEDAANNDAWTVSTDQPSFTVPNNSSQDQLRSLP